MRDILVSFDLTNAAGADYGRAYRYLVGLGFQVSPNGVMLPNTVVIGKWHLASSAAEIRDMLWTAMRAQGIPLANLLVAEFSECAWFGDKSR